MVNYPSNPVRPSKKSFSQHCGYVNRNVEATGKHFNLQGHSKNDMQVIYSQDVWMREEIESHSTKASIKNIN